MNLDKEYWKKLTFFEDNSTEIFCPFCAKGHLKFIKDQFFKQETEESKHDHKNEDWEPSWIRYRFSAILKCDYSRCGEVVTCLGKGWVEENMVYNDENDYWQEDYKDAFSPLYFSPSLHIIHPKEDYPAELNEKLISSFSHFFSDTASCANKIRICIEILMDKLNVKKTTLTNRKRKNLPLHNRILEFKRQNSIVADYLLAIKWIGNFGSHIDDLTKDDILDAYQLLDYSLKKIYDSETKEVIKLTKEINRRKAPRSTRKIKSGF